LNITATDPSSNVNWSIISVTVQDDTGPIWDPTPTDQNVDLGVSFSYDVNATDSKTITYGINDTVNFKIKSSTGLIENNAILSLGVYVLNITAMDSSSNVNWSVISITVQDDTAPIWDTTPTDQNVDLGVSFSYYVNATDSQTITYGIDDTYNFYLNPSTGLITNTTILALGVYVLNITATDLSSNVNWRIISVTVQDDTEPIWNPTPTDQNVDFGVSFSYDVHATDLQTITYGIDNTDNFSINPSTGLITNTTILALGVYGLNITATDPSSNVNWRIISVTVQDDTGPIWDPTPTDQNVDLGVSFSYDVHATDSQTITYGIDNTDNFYINPSTGLITNNKILAVGVYDLNITATDPSSNVNWSIISVTVQDDTAPIWDPTPTDQNVDIGVSFSYDVNATDSQTITYGINNTVNFKINPSTGLITNNAILALGVYGLNITAMDSSSNVNWRIISVTVQNDTGPIWDPIPTDQNVDLGVSFSYDVTATDSQTITYGINDIVNFSINTSTGLITNNTILALSVYFLNITATDSSSNLNWRIISVTVQRTSDGSGGSSGGGGGGGGGTSGEAFENIVCTETDRQFVGKDLNVKYNYVLEGNYVQHIEFTGLISAGKVAAKVEMLNHTSTIVDKDAPNIVFKNLNVWVGNIGYFSENNVKDPTIAFMVDRSWVKDNDIILNSINFYSYNDYTNTWEKMQTQKIGEDSASYQFKASLPIRGSLGPMAISGREVIIIPTSEPNANPGGLGMITTPTQSNTEQPTPKITQTTLPVTWTGTWNSKVPGFQLLAALIALITLYFISRRQD